MYDKICQQNVLQTETYRNGFIQKEGWMVWYSIAWYSTLIQYNYFNLYMYPLLFYFWYLPPIPHTFFIFFWEKSLQVSEILVSSCGMTSTDAEKPSETNASPEGEVTAALDQGPSPVNLGKNDKKERSKTRTTTTGNLEQIHFFWVGEGDVLLLEMVMDDGCLKMLGWLVFFFNVWTLVDGIYGSLESSVWHR